MTDGCDNREETFAAAQAKALRLLSYGPRSKRGLYDKLLETGHHQDAAEAAVTAMERYGYINDNKMAGDYASYAIEHKGHGRYRVIRDLCGKGISKELAERALNAYFEDADEDGAYNDPELLNAVAVMEKRLSQLRLEPDDMDDGDKRRMFGYLQRRGFSYETTRRAFSELGQDAGEWD